GRAARQADEKRPDRPVDRLRRHHEARRRAHPLENQHQRAAAGLIRTIKPVKTTNLRTAICRRPEIAMFWYLFSFEGRINRAKYWLAVLIILALMIALMLLTYVPVNYLFGTRNLDIDFSLDHLVFPLFDPRSYRGLSPSDLGSIIIHAIVVPPVLW